jgi:hypothetical protein
MELTAPLFCTVDRMEIADRMPLMKRQCLGRLFRVGQSPVVVVPIESIEDMIANRIQQRLIVMGKTTKSTGLSLHHFQKKVAKKMLRKIDKMGNTDTFSV